ncbi:glycosyltransferase family 2 protein [Pediococcus acidilactici]
MEDKRIHILHHEVNRGKGAALKTGFKYILENFPQIQGVATMDADGQHTVEALAACINQFEKHPHDLIIGARQFTNQIPWRSQFGNVLTRKLVRMLTRQNISDTQTGLRVIPRSYVRQLLKFPGKRFEFEFDMLL